MLRRLRAHTPHTIVRPEVLRAEIAAVRVDGYAINREGWRPGVSGAAAPVLVGRDNAIAALAILGPSDRLDEARLHAAGRLLAEVAADLSRTLGHDFPPKGPARAA